MTKKYLIDPGIWNVQPNEEILVITPDIKNKVLERLSNGQKCKRITRDLAIDYRIAPIIRNGLNWAEKNYPNTAIIFPGDLYEIAK